MKRSKMLVKLLYTVTDHIPYEGPVPEYVDDLIEDILNTVEKAGMLPPRWYDKSGAYEMYRYTWEPEDD